MALARGPPRPLESISFAFSSVSAANALSQSANRIGKPLEDLCPRLACGFEAIPLIGVGHAQRARALIELGIGDVADYLTVGS